jgi:hypothetical protein
MLFHEAMEDFGGDELEESFGRFERAAAKGHEEAIWILSVVEGGEMEKRALKEAFAKTEEPLGWWFAGEVSSLGEQFEFFAKSAEGGGSWGQVKYGMCFGDQDGVFVEKDEKVYVEWLEKAANQNNPRAMVRLGSWFRNGGGHDKQKAVSYFRAAAELGWKGSMRGLAKMLAYGKGCVKDLIQAAIWSAKGSEYVFWGLLGDAKQALGSGRTEELDCDFNKLRYSLGWGLYWYQYEAWGWKHQFDYSKVFGERCLDYYCSCIELQQKSIVTFLLCWNRTTGGVKGPGQMIAQMVWEGRGDNLVKTFEKSAGEERLIDQMGMMPEGYTVSEKTGIVLDKRTEI